MQMFNALPPPDAPLPLWAEWYANAGIPIFPCRPRGKEPLTTHGYKDATSDLFQVVMWWRQHPQANIGAASGQCWWALDVDPRHGGDATLAQLEMQHGPLPDTARVLSGRGEGEHYLFALPASGTIRHKANIGPGLDVIVRGGATILPPSIHPESGNPYRWDVGSDLEEPGLVSAPEWLIALVCGDQRGETAHEVPDMSPGLPILEGERESTLVRMGGSLRHAGGDYETIYAMLQTANQRCQPPLEDQALQRIARSVTRYDIDPVLEVGGARIQWGAEAPAPSVPKLHDVHDLMGHYYPLPHWLVKGLIPEGLTFFAGSPKSSKTYLAYSLALSLAFDVAQEQPWLGQYDLGMQGPVIYLSLEDDAADTQYRIRELAPGLTTIPGRLLFYNSADLPSLQRGFTAMLEALIQEHKPSAVFVDPLSYLYESAGKKKDPFTEVREMLLPLRWLGKMHHCAIIGIEHRRKKSADDVDIIETMYGSNAKMAIADSALLIVRDSEDITIHVRMRRGADHTLSLALHFDEQGRASWEWKGSVDGLVTQGKFGDLRDQVLQAIQKEPLPISVTDLILLLELPDSKAMQANIRQILFRSHRDGLLEKTTRGRYVWTGAV